MASITANRVDIIKSEIVYPCREGYTVKRYENNITFNGYMSKEEYALTVILQNIKSKISDEEMCDLISAIEDFGTDKYSEGVDSVSID